MFNVSVVQHLVDADGRVPVAIGILRVDPRAHPGVWIGETWSTMHFRLQLATHWRLTVMVGARLHVLNRLSRGIFRHH
jgi:hypothetical protein